MLSIFAQGDLFEINTATLISFLIGIGLGAILVCLIYVVSTIGSLRNKRFLIKTEDDSLTVQQVKEIILQSQKDFKDKKLRAEKSKVEYCKDLCFSLVYNISTKFYPHSKYPLFELSVDEVLILLKYVSDRLNEILDRRGIRRLKKIRISTIVNVSDKANKIIGSNSFKMSKEVSTVVTTVKKVVNVVNPVWWFRKTIFDTTVSILTDKICLVLIAIIGEETYKIYSKRVFKKDVEIDTNIEAIMNSIDDDFKESLEKIKSNEEAKEIQKEFFIENFGDAFPLKSNSFILEKSYKYESNIDLNMPMKGLNKNEKEKESNIS